MQNPSKGPGGSFIEGDQPSDPTMVWAILIAWLLEAREQITEDRARNTVQWVSDSLGIQHDDLLQAGGFIGHPDAPNLTVNEAIERYGDPVAFTLSMVLLCGGLVATAGDADPNWLKQFDLASLSEAWLAPGAPGPSAHASLTHEPGNDEAPRPTDAGRGAN